jgi:hypothetical protein
LFTDKKISKQATDRRMYHAPTENGITCPFLAVDANGVPVRIDMDTDPHDKKMQKCKCTESAPMCSYHLNDGNMDPRNPSAIGEYYCHRYEIWSANPAKPPVDTHERQLRVKNNEIGWHK